MRIPLSILSLIALPLASDLHAKAVDAKGILVDASGTAHGTVSLSVKDGMIHGTVRASGLQPGQHGMHIHAVGQCTGEGFSGAGGHWNPDQKQHGLQNPMGAHRGDLPQLTVARNGKVKASFMLMSALSDLLDADGAALVIHANPDDGKTDPSGNSGARLLCAVITSGG